MQRELGHLAACGSRAAVGVERAEERQEAAAVFQRSGRRRVEERQRGGVAAPHGEFEGET